MRKVHVLRVALLAFGLMFAPPLAAAHPGHGLEMEMSPRELALSSAVYVVDTMVSRGAIDPSWREIEPSEALLRQRDGAPEWVVTFRNPGVRDPAHRTLYVMLSQTGEYIAANYTGN